MKKRVLTLIASLIVVAGLLASQGSNAWFVTAVKRAQNITIGAVSYSTGDAVSLDTVEEDFYGRPRIYPGQNLIVVNGEESALTMFNSSTIDTKIRVKIEYTSYKDGKAQTAVYRGAEDEDLEVEFADNSQWKLLTTEWTEHVFTTSATALKAILPKRMTQLPLLPILQALK